MKYFIIKLTASAIGGAKSAVNVLYNEKLSYVKAFRQKTNEEL